MNVLAFLGALGRALVTRGLGGPGEVPPPIAQSTPCSEIHLVAPNHTVVRLATPRHTVVRVEAEC